MASLLSAGAASLAAAAVGTPPPGEVLSGVFGSISLTAWICLLLPQLITNYKAKSADGLSMAFLFVWLLGDVTNLLGALATGLAPTGVALAIYFCFADLILIGQSLYYNALNARRAARARRRASEPAAGTAPEMTDDMTGADGDNNTAVEDADEEAPLLARQHHQRRRSSSMGLPGSHRRNSTLRRDVSNLDPLARIITGEDETPDRSPWLHNALSLLAVYAVGTAGFFLSYHMGAWSQPAAGDGAPKLSEGDADAVMAFGMVMGYVSAVLYLCARIPQIWKNYQEKSCEGGLLLSTVSPGTCPGSVVGGGTIANSRRLHDSRTRPAVFPPVLDWQFHLRREPGRLFPRPGLSDQDDPLAVRVRGDHCRGLRHICAVPYL
ncbi:hypothetical protein RB598_006251 [Gaeumannomyces tritici]